MNSRLLHIGWAVLSGILLGLAALFPPAVILLFVAVVPLLEIKNDIVKNKGKKRSFFLYSTLAFFVYHLIGGNWMLALGAGKMSLAFFINSLILSTFVFGAIVVHQRWNRWLGDIFFIAGWIAFEYLHLNWELSFPILMNGHHLAVFPQLIQWYTFTGILGGTLWVLGVNVLLSQLFSERRQWKERTFWQAQRSRWLTTLAVLFLPILISVVQYSTYNDSGEEVEVVSLHSDLDCYNTKYRLNQGELVSAYWNATKDALTPFTRLILWPESAITDFGWVEGLDNSELVAQLRDSIRAYCPADLVTGGIIYELFANGNPPNRPATVGYSPEINQSFYTYTMAMQIRNKSNEVSMRTKKKLVPFEETIPYPSLLSGVHKLAGSLGGFTFSPKKRDAKYMELPEGIRTIPLICYESAYGAFTADAVRKRNLNLLTVMLNEGWYSNIAGAKQLLNASVARAIENRKSVLRSSNRGVSALINPRGEIVEQVDEFKSAAIRRKVQLNEDQTPYMVIGDWLGWLSFLAMPITLGGALLRRPQVKPQQKKRKR